MALIRFQNVSETFARGGGSKLLRSYVGLILQRPKHDPFFALKDVTFTVEHGESVAIIGSKADLPVAKQIIDAVPAGCVVDGVGTLSLLASAELIGRAQAIVTNDSAPQHLASAMGTPTLAIFGPTVPEFGFGPLAERKAVAGHSGLSCRPCHRHGPQRCPLGHWRCMRELTPDYISSLLTEVLNPPVPV